MISNTSVLYSGVLKTFSKDLDFIMDMSLCPDSDREKAVNSIIRTYQKTGSLLKDIEAVRNSTVYKVAEILALSNTWKELSSYVKSFLPSYKRNPKAVLDVGGINWRIPFIVPEKRHRAVKPIKTKTIPIPEITPPPPIQYDIDNLLKEIRDLKIHIKSLEEKFYSHGHCGLSLVSITPLEKP